MNVGSELSKGDSLGAKFYPPPPLWYRFGVLRRTTVKKSTVMLAGQLNAIYGSALTYGTTANAEAVGLQGIGRSVGNATAGTWTAVTIP